MTASRSLLRSTRAVAVSGASLLMLSGWGEPGRSLEPASVSSSGTGVVAYATDGDTLRLTDGRTVRLLQVDAPELHGDCFGKAALTALRRLAPKGARVTLFPDPTLDATDRYGRALRYLFVGGTNVNVALVREGAASPYFFRKARGRYARVLLDAVAEARHTHRGYWGACPRAKLNTGVGSTTGPA